MTSKGLLIGYVRRSKRGRALKMDLGLEEFLSAKRYTGRDGKEYVSLVMNINALKDVVSGDKEVTSVCQLR